MEVINIMKRKSINNKDTYKNKVKQSRRKLGEAKQYPYEFIPNLSHFVDIDEQRRKTKELEQEI